MLNILITSVGRRSYLVEYFKKALNGVGKVICANMYADAAAMYVGDISVVTPPSHEKTYIPTIIEICKKYNIKLIFSFHDLDVYILSQHLDSLRQTGAVPVLPSAKWGKISLDKYECSRILQENNIDVPWFTVNLQTAKEAIKSKEIHYPLIVKARMGFGSLGLVLCHNAEELDWAFHRTHRQVERLMNTWLPSIPSNQNVLIQQAITGKEYCLDVINDLSGNYACDFLCEVHSMRAGETDMVTTADRNLVGDLPIRLSSLTRHLGSWGIDCMEDNGVYRVIDVNPRFTGDYPFHQVTGANIPAALISWAQGIEPDSEWLKAESGIRCYKDLVPKRLK
jgi:carbamoyl-phosphate synthase large subunit